MPGIPSLAEGQYSCPRCADDLAVPAVHCAGEETKGEEEAKGEGRRAKGVGATAGVEAQRECPPEFMPPLYDGWELDEELRHIERILRTDKPEEPQQPQSQGAPQQHLRLDPPHGEPAAWHRPIARKPLRRPQPTASEGDSALGTVTWMALSVGTMSFVCGGVLLGWSLATGRQELWSIGTPIALAGQIGLLIGLVLQLDRLWRDGRTAAAKLDTVDQQLHELQTTTNLLGTTHGPSGTFYAHLADGAGPHLLLNDLKSQLDLLAMKLGRDSRD